jgi:predicted ATPase with chaperone activity
MQFPVGVEVDVSGGGLPGLTMVGCRMPLFAKAATASEPRFETRGFQVPSTRITVSLAPSDMRKVGASFDLPIALGILAASGVLPHHADRPLVVVGGLSLDGGVPPMRGVLPIAAMAGKTGAASCFPTAIWRKPESSKDCRSTRCVRYWMQPACSCRRRAGLLAARQPVLPRTTMVKI